MRHRGVWLHHTTRGAPSEAARCASQAALYPVDLYRQLAESRAAVIEEALANACELPEAPAETLTLAAAALAHFAGVSSTGTARGALVARRLTAEAGRLDARAGALAECWLEELEAIEPEQRTGLLQEAADSLAWAAAVLRHLAEGSSMPRTATPSSSSSRGSASQRPGSS